MCSVGVGLLTHHMEISNQMRVLYIFPALCAILQSFLQARVYIHESPKYLVQKDMMKECEEALASIYSSFEAIQNELTSLLRQRNRPPVSYKLLFGPIFRNQFFVGCGIFYKTNRNRIIFLSAIVGCKFNKYFWL